MMFLQMQNSFELNRLKADPSRVNGTTHCNRSGLCCWKRPARLTQEDLARLAESMKVSKPEFFKKYCAVDDVGGLCVILRRHHQQGGEWITVSESYSVETPCVFFDDDSRSCEVHPVKPAECARHGCWDKTDARPVPWTRQQILDLGWNGCDDG